MRGKHWHHVVPKHAGGTDDPSNLVLLSIEEHADAHRKLYEKYGRSGDLIAWKALSGDYSKDEFHREAASDRWKIENPMFLERVKKDFSERMKRDNPMHDPEAKKNHLDKVRSQSNRDRVRKMKTGNTNTKGKSWFNNGKKTGMFFECPEGWTKGRNLG